MNTNTQSNLVADGISLGSVEYWKSELMRLRRMWGEKSFWVDIEKAGIAMQGLLYVWVNTKDTTAQDEMLMSSTVMEFDRRLLFAVMIAVGSNEQGGYHG